VKAASALFEGAGMSKWMRDNGLSITLFVLFGVSIVGHGWSGWLSENEERAGEGLAVLGLSEYLQSGSFISTVFENWESEFLQMGMYVCLTAYLFQRGSPESKDPDEPAPQDRDPKLDSGKPEAPWPVRAGGLARSLYSHSLGIALFSLFAVSFALHLGGSAAHAADEARIAGETPPTLGQHLGSATFWFESFQNWQSEFLSTALLIVLAIFLRERGSPESKPVGAPHTQTGTD
jgi:uncharacterized protein DUF6766